MDLLHGYPDVDAFDPLLTVDHVRLLNLLQYYTDHATVVEEMLVALLHMQIDVCHFRQGRKKRYEGRARFRKQYNSLSAGAAGGEADVSLSHHS